MQLVKQWFDAYENLGERLIEKTLEIIKQQVTFAQPCNGSYLERVDWI